MAKRSDEEWVAALRSEDSSEQDQAFQDLGRYLYRVVYNHVLRAQAYTPCLSSLASRELEELCRDCVQRAWVKICQKLDQYAGRGRFTSWVATIAVNEARQVLREGHWRRRVCPPTTMSPGEEGGEISFEDWLSDLVQEVGESLCPEQRVQFEEVMDIVRCIVDEDFSKAQRIAFIGRFFLEKTNLELAETLRCPINRVYGLIYECRVILRHRLEKADYTLQDVYAIFK
jgi:RNA polymerase sigma factor (sigma-70 family)